EKWESSLLYDFIFWVCLRSIISVCNAERLLGFYVNPPCALGAYLFGFVGGLLALPSNHYANSKAAFIDHAFIYLKGAVLGILVWSLCYITCRSSSFLKCFCRKEMLMNLICYFIIGKTMLVYCFTFIHSKPNTAYFLSLFLSRALYYICNEEYREEIHERFGFNFMKYQWGLWLLIVSPLSLLYDLLYFSPASMKVATLSDPGNPSILPLGRLMILNIIIHHVVLNLIPDLLRYILMRKRIRNFIISCEMYWQEIKRQPCKLFLWMIYMIWINQ
ncbi:MAG: hypothetical protein ACPGC9_01970, partial [Cytophagales bacterium]